MPRWDLVARGDQRYLLCPALADLGWLRHGFSVGPALNFGLHVGEEPAPAVIARREGFLAGLGLEFPSLVAAQQVHGTRVAVVGEAERGAGAVNYAEALPETDGLATQTTGLIPFDLLCRLRAAALGRPRGKVGGGGACRLARRRGGDCRPGRGGHAGCALRGSVADPGGNWTGHRAVLLHGRPRGDGTRSCRCPAICARGWSGRTPTAWIWPV